MIEIPFSLVPFPAPDIPEVTITGAIGREGNLLKLHYRVVGKIEDILLPAPCASPGRKDELWKQTCFEFFLAPKEEAQYWEFNMSPSGDWNIYHMGAYRRVGFREETAMAAFPFERKLGPDGYLVDAMVDVSPIIAPEQELRVAIAAVIQTKDGGETYWALTHPAGQADFHRRESFVLGLAGQTQRLRQSSPGS